MSNSFANGLLKRERLVVGVTVASEACRKAQQAHQLGTTSAIALGRLMIASVLVARTQQRAGSLSLQIVAKGRVRQVFADINETGDVRGYVKPGDLAMPPLSAAERHGRRQVGHALRDGVLSMIRIPPNENFSQSSTELVSGEVDADVEHFLSTSDQIPSALVADVLFDDDNRVSAAGGLLVQAMPGGDVAQLDAIRTEIKDGRLIPHLTNGSHDAGALLRVLFPEAEVTTPGVAIQWKCRCSKQRVLSALAMLDPADLADMANQSAPVEIDCEFCAAHYTVSSDEVGDVFDAVVKAQSKFQQN